MDEYAFCVTVIALVAMCLNRPLGISFRGFGMRIGGKEIQQAELKGKQPLDEAVHDSEQHLPLKNQEL